MVRLACEGCSEEIVMSKEEFMDFLRQSAPTVRDVSAYLEQRVPVPMRCPKCGSEGRIILQVVEKQFD